MPRSSPVPRRPWRLPRRRFLQYTLASLAASKAAAEPATVSEGLSSSDVVYLTPLHSDGHESSCQSEIWFVTDGDSLYVVTAAESWRARAVARGLTARIWVGNVGYWQDAQGGYRRLPKVEATAADVASEPEVREKVLKLYAAKYPMSWLVYGPRFRKGLADGSRVMLRYRLARA